MIRACYSKDLYETFETPCGRTVSIYSWYSDKRHSNTTIILSAIIKCLNLTSKANVLEFLLGILVRRGKSQIVYDVLSSQLGGGLCESYWIPHARKLEILGIYIGCRAEWMPGSDSIQLYGEAENEMYNADYVLK